VYSFPRIVANRLLLAALCVPLAALAVRAQVSVRGIKVLGNKDTVEIEVESSERVVPQTRVLTGPDRLVIDFPNTVPGPQMRNQSVDRGEVKDVRFGLFQGKPPVTRIVLDLKTAQSYQVFPYGRTTIIKVVGNAPDAAANSSVPSQSRPGLVTANYTPGAAQVQVAAAPQPLIVTFHKGLLAIKSDKATLSEVLLAVQQRTGAEVSVAAGAEQEKVVVDIGPAPAPEVLAQLLHGSNFNFLILSAANDPKLLDRVILTPRSEGGIMPLAQMPSNANDAEEDVAANPQPPPPPPPVQNNRPPNDNNGPQDDPPDQ
jgi:AMIN domain